MDFKNQFPNLYQFLGGYFPDADFDNLTDEDVVKNYVDDCKKSKSSIKSLEETKEELLLLINKIDIYLQDVENESNRYFENSQDALVWLNMIKRELEK
ncbi:hypothetical protein EGY07_16395 [Chryseobacterium indologenes]|uniref:contact-dependent growth inhibition system immunity protein n=1 Tax=Chryseobacterium indologenes TaxID=253 RepID=UPI000F4ECB20|nr:hypothetical protein [Chryseobacterium indologenes]AYZ37023.1 hypothetical protein EGY07_16395 [Chryseobacterium indologenes]MBF6645859.1 hypothetical protein [Chryseobacterium indologenes]MBU3048393.1 hypothetical protein [Chryseobacterium indologenes]MEB4760904.1 hypothetical protein [Chryseobacterium indologenes]QQQ70476.1 hypothetical protein JHW31_18620 [Chryseobacterium indologenes]